MIFETPKPWPENALPTINEFAAWLRVCTDKDLTEVARRWLTDPILGSWMFLDMQKIGTPIYTHLRAAQIADLYNNTDLTVPTVKCAVTSAPDGASVLATALSLDRCDGL